MRNIITSYLVRFLIFAVGILPIALQSQPIATYGSASGAAGVPQTYAAMIQGLFGNGVQISNLTVNCDTVAVGTAAQMGWFAGPGINFTLGNGLLMTSGSIGNAIGPNAQTGISTALLTPGDADLTALAGIGTNDACGIEFDVYTTCDTIGIKYVFASDEYMEYANSTINDAFAFFLTGPNPAGGNYVGVDIATIPVVGLPVTLNNVNCTVNPAYYVCNENNVLNCNLPSCPPSNANTSIEYDGLTVSLWAKAPIIPCNTYHVKIVIADGSDNILDSGVFLEAGGITCLGASSLSINTFNIVNPAQNTAEEGCSSLNIQFHNQGDSSISIPIAIQTIGTATSGADYPPVPPILTIPAGSSTLNYTFTPNSDAILEGLETVGLVCTYTACGGTFTDTIYFSIIDPVVVDAGPNKATCAGLPIQIGQLQPPGNNIVSYAWTPTTNLSPTNTPITTANLVLPPGGNNVTQTYTLTVADYLGCTAQDQVSITYTPIPAAAIAMQDTACIGALVSANYAGTPLLSGGTYTWTFNNAGGGLQGLPSQSLTWNQTGLQTISIEVANGGCASLAVPQSVFIRPQPSSNFTVTPSVCFGQEALVTYTGGAPLSSSFNWSFPGSTNVTPLPNQSYLVAYPLPGNYLISLTVNQAGCIGAATTKPTTVLQNPTSNFAFPNNICINDLNQVVYTGTADTTAVYNWNFGDAVVLSGSGQGLFLLSWTTPSTQNIHQICLNVIENGCLSDTNCQIINVLAAPTAAFTATPDTACLVGNSFAFLYTGTPGASSYTWNFGPSANPPSVLNVANPFGIVYSSPGPKIVSLQVTNNGCKSDTAFGTVMVIPQPDANFNASTNTTCLGGCITYTYTGVINPQYPAQAYSWDFGSGSTPATSTLPNPGCVQYTTPGFKTITLTVNLYGCIAVVTQQIFVGPGSPQITAGPDRSFCEGDGPVELLGDVLVGSGVPAYGYSWWCNNSPLCGIDSVNVLTPQVNPGLSPTTYYFQVTDAIGCQSNIDSTVVTIKKKPIANAGPDKAICADPLSFGTFLDGSVVNPLQCPGPYTYSWTCNTAPNCGMNPGQEILEDPYVRPLQTTIYTFIVTAANGCTSVVNTLDTVSTVTVTVNPTPQVEAGAYKEICFGGTVQMTGYGVNLGTNCTYQWTPNTAAAGVAQPTNPTTFVSPTQTTTYTLAITCSGCTGTDTVTVKVNNLPTGAIEPPTWAMCQGDSVQLDGHADGDPFGNIYQYSWTPSTGLSNPNIYNPWAYPTTTTEYTLTVSSPTCKGFTDTILITINPTPITTIITPDTLVCAGDSLKLSLAYNFVGTPVGSPIIINWTPSANLNTPNAATTWAHPTQTTVYTANVSVSGGCNTSDQVTISVTPPVPANATADTTNICAGGQTILHATGGLGSPVFVWSPSYELSDSTSQNPIASPDVTTTYTLQVWEGACKGTDVITINVLPQPTIDFAASNIHGCVPLEVAFFEQATNELYYLWNFGDGSPISNNPNPTHIYTQPGSYNATFKVTGVGGCESSVNVGTVTVGDTTFANFTSNPPIDSVLYLPSNNVQFTDLSLNAVAWVWNFGDGATSAEQNPSHAYLSAGQYTVSLVVTNSDGCTSHISKYPYTVLTPGLLVPNTFTPNDDGFHDTWVLNYDGTESFELGVYDRWGNYIFTSKSPTDNWDGKDNKGRPVAEGTYYYSLRIGKKVYNGHVLVVR